MSSSFFSALAVILACIGLELVEAGYFQLLGIQAIHGRVFIPEDDAAGSGDVVILGHNFWRRHFGNDLQILGKTIRVKNLPFLVVGIMPEGFRGQAGTADLWTPLRSAEKLMDDGALKAASWWWLRVIARLKAV